MEDKYKYAYPFADLIDRLVITQLKSIFIQEHTENYKKEMEDIMHDINLNIQNKNIELNSKIIHAVIVNSLSNFFIWMNESRARKGGKEQDKLLKLTHSINGVRNTSKNMISHEVGQRKDMKIDCLASEFLTKDAIKKYGNWNIWEER